MITNPEIGDVFRAFDNGCDYEVILVDAHQVVLKHVTLRLTSVYELHSFYRPVLVEDETRKVA